MTKRELFHEKSLLDRISLDQEAFQIIIVCLKN